MSRSKTRSRPASPALRCGLGALLAALAPGGAVPADGQTAGAPAPPAAARDAIAPLLRRLSEAASAQELAAAARELRAALDAAGAAGAESAPRAEAAPDVRGAVRAVRDRMTARLRNTVESSFRSQIPKLKAELARRRDAAVGLVQDPAAYPEGDKAAQARVEEKAAAVRELWEHPLPAFARLTPAIGKDLDAVNAAAAEALRAAGLDPGADDGVSLDSLLADAGEALKIFRTTAADSAERKTLDTNRKVAAANAALKGPAPRGDASLEARSAKPEPSPSGTPAEALEQAEIVNAYREMMGLRVLEVDERLCRAAQAHAVAMARQKKLWHVGEDGSPTSRAEAAGFRGVAVAENICGVLPGARAAHDAWIRSAVHHRVLLDSQYTLIGVGARDGYWTQLFAAKPRLPATKKP